MGKNIFRILQDDNAEVAYANLLHQFSGYLQFLILAVLVVAAWKLLEKAGKPGFVFLIPIYNAAVLIQIAGRPLWWILLLLIPLVNIPFLLLIAVSLAKRFGKSWAFGVGLFVFPPIFGSILAFGKAQYQPNAVS